MREDEGPEWTAAGTGKEGRKRNEAKGMKKKERRKREGTAKEQGRGRDEGGGDRGRNKDKEGTGREEDDLRLAPCGSGGIARKGG